MHIAILASPESWYLRDLRRAAEEMSDEAMQITQLGFSQISSHYDGERWKFNSGECELERFDAVLVRTMPPGSLEQVVFRMDVLGRLEAAGLVVINPARAIEAAVDKYLASAKLQAAGLLTPKTAVCQTAEEAMAAFETLGSNVVVKPIFGGEGRGITRLEDEALAFRAFRMLEQLGAVIYLQEFIEHEGHDLRLFVLGERVLGMKRKNPNDWRTNVSRGAKTEAMPVDEKLAELAQTAAATIGAPIAGVDLLPGRDGQLYAIEVNAVPGWKALSKVLDIDVAKLVLQYIEQAVMEKRS